MARVTVEDCIDKIDNRFDLVLMASHRARAISSGAPINVVRDNDKNPVVALREIGDGKLSPGDLREDVIHALQKHVEVDEPEAEAAPPMVTPNAQAQIELGAEAQFDRMTEEDLLRGLEGLTPPPEPEEEGGVSLPRSDFEPRRSSPDAAVIPPAFVARRDFFAPIHSHAQVSRGFSVFSAARFAIFEIENHLRGRTAARQRRPSECSRSRGASGSEAASLVRPTR